jgi:hypothetical protein
MSPVPSLPLGDGGWGWGSPMGKCKIMLIHALPCLNPSSAWLVDLPLPLPCLSCHGFHDNAKAHSIVSPSSFFHSLTIIHCPPWWLMAYSLSSVLPPPPPKYPTQAGYPTAVPGSTPSQMVETNNQLSHPSGPQYQFLVGEGMPTRISL